jgi:hypothetical protein
MKKLVGWHSPKQYQSGYMSESNSNPAKLPKPRSKYCKKLKGPHVYGKWENYHVLGYLNKPTGLWQRFCTGCNRKDWWSAPSLPGPYFKQDLDARPPGYEKE